MPITPSDWNHPKSLKSWQRFNCAAVPIECRFVSILQPTKAIIMNNLIRFILAISLSMSALAHAADGLIAVKSSFTVKETINRLEENVKQHGLNVLARIDHAAGAAKIGKTLRPTELLIFGNPQGGTPFMECAQTVGIDLPLKALAWEDAQGQVWLGYNDPAYLAQRHGVATCPAAAKLSKALTGLVQATIAH
jgi:uncharacterized protein (DUF302 family)